MFGQALPIAGASVRMGHAEVNVHLYPELLYENGAEWDRLPIAVGQRGTDARSCCDLEVC